MVRKQKQSASQRMSIDELEALLNSEDSPPIEILPNGEIRRLDGQREAPKPLTMRKDLGGEYAST